MNLKEVRPDRSLRQLSARLEPFDSYWQAPADVEKGYSSFREYYRCNFLPHFPADRQVRILVISAGPGYLVKLLWEQGYRNVQGIDSDPQKVEHARSRDLPIEVEAAFPFLEKSTGLFDVIVGEQELNHLTKGEMIEFLKLCRQSLKPGGTLIVYGLNGANPITGPEALAMNLDHFHTLTEYSLRQVLELCGFERIRPFPLKLYVFYRNPLNYAGIVLTGLLHLAFRLLFILYGKSNRIFTKKIGAVARKP